MRGRKIKIHVKYLENLYQAAPMHDIGKEGETMNQNSMLRRNEKEANIIVAKVMRITFVIFTIIYIFKCNRCIYY